MYFGGSCLPMGYLHSHDPQTQPMPGKPCMDPQEQSSPCVPFSKGNALCCRASQKTGHHLDFSFSLSPCIKSLHLFTQTLKYLLNTYNSFHAKAECWGHITATPSSCYLNSTWWSPSLTTLQTVLHSANCLATELLEVYCHSSLSLASTSSLAFLLGLSPFNMTFMWSGSCLSL